MEEEVRYEYYDSKTLLVVNAKGSIRKLTTPIRAQVLGEAEGLVLHTRVQIDEVLSGEKDQLLFVVLGRPYPHRLFRLPVVHF